MYDRWGIHTPVGAGARVLRCDFRGIIAVRRPLLRPLVTPVGTPPSGAIVRDRIAARTAPAQQVHLPEHRSAAPVERL